MVKIADSPKVIPSFITVIEQKILSLSKVKGKDLSIFISEQQFKEINYVDLLNHKNIKSIVVFYSGDNPPSLCGGNIGCANLNSGKLIYPAEWGNIALSLVPSVRVGGRLTLTMLANKVYGIVWWSVWGREFMPTIQYFSNIISRVLWAWFIIFLNKIAYVMVRLVLVKMATKSAVMFISRYLTMPFEILSARYFKNFASFFKTYKTATNYVPGRILVINYALPSGGSERQLVNTCIGLKKRKFNDVEVICDSLEGSINGLALDFYRKTLTDAGVSTSASKLDYINISPRTNFEEHDTIDAISDFPMEIRNEILTYYELFLHKKPEVVHAWQDHTSLIAGAGAVLAGVPNIVLSARNVSPNHFAYYHPWMWQAYRSLLKFPNVRFLVNSHAGSRSYSQWLRITDSTLRVVHNGYDFDSWKIPNEKHVSEVRKKIGIPEGAMVVGVVFRFWPEKDPLLWVETAAEIYKRYQNVYFLLIGAGPLQTEIENLAKERGIYNRMFIPGVFDDVLSVLRIMDVFLLTSVAEGLPNVLVEAQSMSVPVVSTASGGSKEAVMDGKSGWIVKSRNPKILADKVVEVLTDDAWRSESMKLGPKFVRERFGIDRMIDDTINTYFPNKSSERE